MARGGSQICCDKDRLASMPVRIYWRTGVRVTVICICSGLIFTDE
jgi:hypothetical protein